MKQRCCCGRVESEDHADLHCIQALRATTPGQGSEVKILPDVPTVFQIFLPSHWMLLKIYFPHFMQRDLRSVVVLPSVGW